MAALIDVSSWRTILTVLLVALWSLQPTVVAEHVRELDVDEGVPMGHRIGFIGDFSHGLESGPPYLIVPVPGSAVDTDLMVDHTTGEIRTKMLLDRETRSSYSFVAIPLSGENIRVVIRVLDENDNAPTFPQPVMHIEFPENTPRDVKRTLFPARDLDLGRYNTQRYNIVSGNTNNGFRLSSHRERDGVLYLDLQINGFLDRELTPAYTLVIEALDGGTPPLRGQMTVNITIQDVNDNQPIFNQTRYFASVPENATVGTTVLQVFATDLDADENGLIEYSINRRQSDKEQIFRIDPVTGVIEVNKPLDFETRELHELVVVARDNGLQPLTTTAFISIRVTDVNDNQPTIQVIFLSDDSTPKISESAQPGEFVARISVNDPDSKAEYSNVNVTLTGGDGHFGLTTRDNIIYLVIVSLPLDRESQPMYTLNVIASDTGKPPLHATKTIFLQVTDINDNAPEFEQSVYNANVMEVSEPGTSVIKVTALDRDEGNNSMIQYYLAETPETHSQWFQIDQTSGLISTRAHVDCETEPVPELTVIARDNGQPPLSSSAKVLVTIHDVNDNEPIFDQSFYNATLPENETSGRCILKVSAMDPDCGVNSIIKYTLGDQPGKYLPFEIKAATGELCVSRSLDYEQQSSYEFPIIATDRGGLSTTAMVQIRLTDINDNRPVFYPRLYNVSLAEPLPTSSTPIAVIAATDADSGRLGIVSYRIMAGNDAGLFRIDRVTGEIFLTRGNLNSNRAQRCHHLNISASDGGGLRSIQEAEMLVCISDSNERPPVFEKVRYNFYVKEDAKKATAIGSVTAKNQNPRHDGFVKYSIYSGDPGYFTIDPATGTIKVANPLNHEAHTQVLLNIQAFSSENPTNFGHTQVHIEIEDVNDNAPEFQSDIVRLSIPENTVVNQPLYIVNARDRDSGKNGAIFYRLVFANVTRRISPLFTNMNHISGSYASDMFKIDRDTGALTLSRALDFEVAQSHSFIVMASDQGNPQQSANMTVIVDVQDVNDNPPMFDQSEYTVKVSESVAINTQIIQVVANDKDIGNNARLTYSIIDGNGTERNKHCASAKGTTDPMKLFSIHPNSGWLSLKAPLDRESCDYYEVHIMAVDNGSPPANATTKLVITVLDYNDNEPKFVLSQYEFSVEENMANYSVVGSVKALDKDSGVNAQIRYSLVATKSTFDINPTTGVIRTIIPLDREITPVYDLVAEARDQGTPPRSTRVHIKVVVLDVNDNDPIIMDPQEDVVSVREQQPIGTDVVRVRAIDKDSGKNASITYSIVKSRDSDGFGIFVIDANSGIIRTKVVLDHGERSIYRITIAASDNGVPSRQTLKLLRVEVLDLDDNRPTFTSSSLQFKVREDAPIGMIVGPIRERNSLDYKNLITGNSFDVIYTLIAISADAKEGCFDIDRKTGNLVVARTLDRERQQDHKLEVRALDTSSSNNPQSSAITIDIQIIDVNDNAPHWSKDPVRVSIPEDAPIGTVLYNFTATDEDAGANSMIQYRIVGQSPDQSGLFEIDSLTGSFRLEGALDYETATEYILTIQAQDQSLNTSERLTTSLTLFVNVEDVNDNSPEFVVPSSDDAVVVPANYRDVGDVIMRVAAMDKDQGLNGKVSYRIQSGNDRFKINDQTGEVILMKPLMEGSKPTSSNDVDSKQYYDLTIVASDSGKPKRETKRHVRIQVNAAQGKPPRFRQHEYVANVSENVSPGTFVVHIGVNSFDGQNGTRLKFVIPDKAANDLFSIDSASGIIHTKGRLDRERQSSYRVPVFVFETETIGNRKNEKARDLENSVYRSYDMTTVLVNVLDENDNAPEFAPGACYTLSVPENNELTVIHTVAAFDLDDGHNGEIVYSITGGNIGNKFSIDTFTGELTAKPLDREVNFKYLLQITAQDRGSPLSYSASCNISVRVEDQNDNEPRFEMSKYTTKVDENVPIGFQILQVKATDPDWGINARIIYSLANESHWLFTIDNKSGVISTTGYFDREQESVYNFAVIATDGGKYDSRSQQVPVQVFIVDVNDNKPVFDRHPFSAQVPTLVQPGQALIQVSAIDLDQGINGEIFYSLAEGPKSEHFRINPVTGVLSTTQSLASDSGKLVYVEVIATDKGNPPLSTSGLIELKIGEISSNYPKLLFKNDTYRLNLKEHMPTGSLILHLQAVRSDGRRNRITYGIVSGSRDAEAFHIDANNGEIRVADEEKLDYEIYKEKTLRLTIVAKSEESVLLYGFCTVEITLEDVNDNAPRFTQQQYSTRVWEGNNKGTFVFQVQAFDADSGLNSKVLYHIVDGNHDNAFIIEPAFSGILKTNIVLDREIRDTYRLKIIATDEGVPQLTGTGTIIINIIDINDNQPTFPPKKVITVNEGTEIGSVLTTITANDVDTSPVLTYSLVDVDPLDAWANKYLAMDQFSGKIILTRKFDYESRKEYQVKIIASDAVASHTAETILTIRIADENDNSPVFDRAGYFTTLPDSSGTDEHEILSLNSTDMDSGDNAVVKYSFLENLPGFRIDSNSGVLFANISRIDRSRGSDIFLTVVAKDGGLKPRTSETSVLIHLSEKNLHASFNQKQFRVSINEDLPPGSVVVRLAQSPFGPMNALISENANFKIVSGNLNDSFRITYPNATIVVAKPLDRETVEFYHLQVAIASAGRDENATISVFVSINDANDNFPVFSAIANYSVEISEATSIKQSIAKVEATDADQENSPNSEIAYDITSGNDLRVFSIDLVSGVIFVNHHLDYETGPSEYHLNIRACDSGLTPRCALQPFTVFIRDANDNEPIFPVSEYLEVVGENEQTGLSVFTARATDLDRGEFGILNYSIERSPNDDEGWKVFAVNSESGVVAAGQTFDYEQKSLYEFRIKATDAGMKSITVNVKVMIESRDEFSPQFTERTYRFSWQLANSDQVPMGASFGHVSAVDKDKGPDGRILYQLTNAHPYFKVNRTTGAIVTKKKLTRSMIATEREISLVVTASSGLQGSLSNMTVVEIVFASANGGFGSGSGDQGSAENLTSGLADWALALLILLILVVLSFATVFVFLHMRNRRHKQTTKPNLNTSDMVVGGHNNAYVDDPSNFDTIQIGRGTAPSGGQFGPPKYDEIPPYGRPHHGPAASSNSGAPTTSELSGSEQSNSSGRGSAEDGEGVDEDDGDEEIRMINEGNLQVGMGMNSDDRLSEVSVQNTQEYLARLGIVDTLHTTTGKLVNPGHGTSTSSRHGGNDALMPIEGMYDDDDDEDDQNDADLRNIIYAKLNDVTGGGGGVIVSGSGAGSAGPGTVVGGNGGSGRMSCVDDAATTNGSGSVVGGDHGFGHDLHPVVGAGHHGMNGSLSSIVHSEEELTGSYNWDYLLDWGPQYQPLAHVFSEIARLKDDTMSVHSGNSGMSSSTKGGSMKHGGVGTKQHLLLPPPLLTNVAPRTVPGMPSKIGGNHPTIPAHHQYLLPRSPISHDASNGFVTTSAISPSFSPNLSPLARSPSVSPPPHLRPHPPTAPGQHTVKRKNY